MGIDTGTQKVYGHCHGHGHGHRCNQRKIFHIG
jgi:hypothetical protein